MKHKRTDTKHACFHCRHTGQPVEPTVLTLRATDRTPPDWPQEVRVQTHICIDATACRRRVLTYTASEQRIM